MPLVKRGIKPQHMCRGALPEGVASELECVTNNTLSAIIRQLSSLSKHAEDVFGELFDEANTFHVRANSLQDRIDRLAIKVTQLDSGVEEVSLQDINMRKAFRSVSAQDQQVVSRSSIPVPVGEMYESCERPPPLDVLSEYREDHADGMKFYTDPAYFFDLWKEKMLQDTEDKKREKRRQREQKSFEDGTLQREVKKVRKARNRRQEWNMMAFDKELRPDRQHSHVVQWGVLSEGSLSPTARMDDPNLSGHAHFLPHHVLSNRNEGVEHEYQSIGEPANMADGFGDPIDYRFNPPPPPHTEGGVNGDIILPPVDYGFPECFPSSCPPPDLTPTFIPSPQTAFTTPLTALPPPLSHSGPISSIVGYPLPPVPSPGTGLTPPPPGPPPPPVPPAMSHLSRAGEGRGAESPPVAEGRSDLLSAIRMGIQLKKVQEQQEQRAIRERSSNDVASILSRRIAVEYSDSEEESELEENEWTD